MRTIIELPGEQLDQLAELCQAEGISRAEAIRRAIAEYTRGRRAKEVTAAFGLWRNRPVDALKYERGLREEWERPHLASARHQRVPARASRRRR
jgi:hypothetical protein